MTPNADKVRRWLDTAMALCALLLAVPLLLVAAAAIVISSPGPVVYPARRIGQDRRRGGERSPQHGAEKRQEGAYRGREFTIYKLRTMRPGADLAAPITAHNDSRVFPVGAWLRAAKVDELPQLLNILKGDMGFVGPRPEAPDIVRQYYRAEDLDTLQVRPGLTSPGSLYYYTHCEAQLREEDGTLTYAERILPLKLALDRVYLANASLLYDCRILLRTFGVIGGRALGRRTFPDPPELAKVASVRGETIAVARRAVGSV